MPTSPHLMPTDDTAHICREFNICVVSLSHSHGSLSVPSRHFPRKPFYNHKNKYPEVAFLILTSFKWIIIFPSWSLGKVEPYSQSQCRTRGFSLTMLKSVTVTDASSVFSLFPASHLLTPLSPWTGKFSCIWFSFSVSLNKSTKWSPSRSWHSIQLEMPSTKETDPFLKVYCF